MRARQLEFNRFLDHRIVVVIVVIVVIVVVTTTTPAKMYCQLHRPVTSGSLVACALGHVGDRIYWIQKGFFLPDALGIVPPPYFPILHVGITALVLVLLTKAMFIDPLQELNCLSSLRGRNKMAGGGHAFFFKRYWRQVVRTFFEIFIVSSVVR